LVQILPTVDYTLVKDIDLKGLGYEITGCFGLQHKDRQTWAILKIRTG
jgi:hypothetical protein